MNSQLIFQLRLANLAAKVDAEDYYTMRAFSEAPIAGGQWLHSVKACIGLSFDEMRDAGMPMV